jgi:hypothetical protein
MQTPLRHSWNSPQTVPSGTSVPATQTWSEEQTSAPLQVSKSLHSAFTSHVKRQLVVQPSVSSALLSSHCSASPTTPSPQVAGVVPLSPEPASLRVQAMSVHAQVAAAVHVQVLQPSPAGLISPASHDGWQATSVQTWCPSVHVHVLQPSAAGVTAPSSLHGSAPDGTPTLPTGESVDPQALAPAQPTIAANASLDNARRVMRCSTP